MEQIWLPGIEVQIADRDSWTTPEWVWRLPLECFKRPRFDLDPCGNQWSTVPAVRTIQPPEDGLSLALRNRGSLVWLNPPYSNVSPWFALARELARRGSHVFGVVPHAPDIKAWRTHGPDLLFTLGRVDFVPPPGVSPGMGGTQEHDLVIWTRSPEDSRFDRLPALIHACGRARVYAGWRAS